MKYKLTRENKIFLLQAIQSGEIETDVLQEWDNRTIKEADEEKINKELDALFLAENGQPQCKRLQRLNLCPYQNPKIAEVWEWENKQNAK